MPRLVTTSLLFATVVTLVAACGDDDVSPAGSSGQTADEFTAILRDPGGREVGTVDFDDGDEGLEVSVDVTGLPPGFHGFHVHAIGACEPDSANPTDPSMTGDFLSAGGHIGAGESDHGEHPGDLPTLYVAGAGTGSLKFVLDALTVADLTDADGSAVMVHASRDNYANIPERYAADGPDEMTLNTGDAGGRIACGTVEVSD